MTTDEYRKWMEDRIETYRLHCDKWGGVNQSFFHVLYVVGILLSAGTTIAGALGHKQWALVIGALSTAVIAYKSEWKPQRIANWYGDAQNQCQRLLADLAIAVTDEDIKKISNRLETLRAGDQFWGKKPADDTQPKKVGGPKG